MARGVVTLVLLVCAAGCSGPGGTSSGGGSGTPGDPPVVSAYRTFFYALCDYYERCEMTLGPLYSSTQACERAQEVNLLLNRATYDAQGTVYDVDQAGLQTCTAALSTSACADRVPNAVLGCLDALQPRTARTVGQVCSVMTTQDAPRCDPASETYCNADADGCGVCAARKANEADCGNSDECLTGYCEPQLLGPAKCKPLPPGKGENEGCLDTLECRGNFMCTGPFLQKRCTARVGVGAMCSGQRNGDAPNCMDDLTCVGGAGGGTCALPSNDNSACARSASNQPGCSGVCSFGAPNAVAGTCGLPNALPGEGDSCATISRGGGTFSACGAGLFPQETITPASAPPQVTACTCRAPQAGGSMCLRDDACVSKVCEGEAGTTPGTCTTLSLLGATCTTNNACETGYCAGPGGMRTCQVRPACL
jgi:hypothetical protein